MLREARHRAGLTQADLARRVGIDPTYLRRIENGKHDPPFSTVVRLATAVGLSLDQIARGEAVIATGVNTDRAKLLAIVERHLVQAQKALRTASNPDLVASAPPTPRSGKKVAPR
jgi:transcriptional regulator with XRE-family HTH domain